MPIDFTGVQRRLADARLYSGAIDGIAGMRTYGALLAFVAGRTVGPTDQMLALGGGCARHLIAYGIDASINRLSHFLGQTCHESGFYRYLREIWGPTEAQKGYEMAPRLGNDQPGDGKRFLGRGLIQLTGRANYAAMAQALDLPLLDQPELAEDPDTAVWTACEFWRSRGLNQLADDNFGDTITTRINGGQNGRDARRQLTARAREILGGNPV